MNNQLTSGSVLKSILRFSLPYLLSYFLQTLYGLADLFIIGQFQGAEGTTAVSIGSQVMHMLTVMIVGLAMGTTVTIGRATGAGDRKEASLAAGNTATLFLGVSVVLTAVLLTLVRPIVSVMSTPAAAVEGTVHYLTICFAGIPFITAYNILSAIFRGLGDSRSPMVFIALACGVNIGLDVLFMGPMALGPTGAALGTAIAQGVSVVLAFWMLRRKKELISLSRGDLRPRREMMSRLLGIGAPIALQDGLIQVSFILITIIVNRRGLTDAAAVGIVEKIISFIFLVPSSMLSTVSALGAQNLGAGKPRRARQVLGYALCITAGFGLIVSLTMQGIAPRVVALFTPDAAVAAAGGEYLRGYIWDSVFAGLHFSFSGYFCALGKSGLSFLHNITAIVLVRIPGAWLMSTRFPETLYPMGLATAFGSLLSAVICVVAFAILTKKGRAGEPTEESGT